MANKYSEAKGILLNDGKQQLLPVSKAQLIELANADKEKFTGYGVNNATSVEQALTYLLNKGNSDLEVAKTYTGTSINGLNSTITAEKGYVLGSITEEAGKLTSYSQIWLDASVVSYNGDSDVKSAIEALQATLAGLAGEGEGSVQSQITATINNLDANAMGETGKAIVSVSEANGVVTATPGNVNAQYVNVDNTTLQWDTNGDNTAESELTVQSAIAYLDSQITALENGAARYTITEVTGNDVPETVAHRYQLTQTVNGASTKVGEYIDIPKDSSLKEVYLGTYEDKVDETSGDVTKKTSTDPQSMNFVYHLANGKYSLVSVDVSKFLSESEFKNGLSVTDHTVSVKIAEGSEEFLTVGADGVKLSGVKNAIDSAKNEAITHTNNSIAGLDSEIAAKTENDFSYVMTGVKEANGKLTAATYIGLTDENVKTTFTSEDAVKVLAGNNDVTDIKKALNLIAGNISSLTTGTLGDITITDGEYVKASNASKNGTTYVFTIDDSALGNVATLNYDGLGSTEVASIFNSNPEQS